MGRIGRGASSLLILAFGLLAGCPEAAPRPNVVLISVDTLRSDHTSAYGYARETTPFLEALASEGVLFEQAYAPTASTGPSHATLFTGTHVLRHGVIKNGLALPPENVTLAEVLSDHGYQTAAVLGSFVLDPKFGFDQGFDFYDADFRLSQSFPGEWSGHRVEKFDRRAEETTDVALEWLDGERDPGRPFLLFCHYFDPHAPYGAPGEWALRFADEPDEEPAAGPEAAPWPQIVRRYDAEIAYTDAQIARLVRHLDAQGLRDDTLVIVTADHGEGLGEHDFPAHAALIYEEAVRVPWVMRWPGHLEAGMRVAEPVALIELLPTVLELLGIDPPAGVQGTSLAGRLRGHETLHAERPIHLVRRHYVNGAVGSVRVKGFKFGLRSGRWKYIEDDLGARELYDLRNDPAESDNRYYDEPALAERMRERTRGFRETSAGDLGVRAIAEEDRRALEALGYVE